MPDDFTPVTPVVVRRWRDIGTLIALFPASPSDYQGRFCDAYEQVGQHGGADYHGVIGATQPVGEDEAAGLMRELERIGYRLKPVKRASRKHHEARREAANAAVA